MRFVCTCQLLRDGSVLNRAVGLKCILKGLSRSDQDMKRTSSKNSAIRNYEELQSVARPVQFICLNVHLPSRTWQRELCPDGCNPRLEVHNIRFLRRL